MEAFLEKLKYEKEENGVIISFSPEFMSEKDNKFLFFVRIEITNNNQFPITFISRNILIRDSKGHLNVKNALGFMSYVKNLKNRENTTPAYLQIGKNEKFNSEFLVEINTKTGTIQGHYEIVLYKNGFIGESFNLKLPLIFLRKDQKTSLIHLGPLTLLNK